MTFIGAANWTNNDHIILLHSILFGAILHIEKNTILLCSSMVLPHFPLEKGETGILAISVGRAVSFSTFGQFTCPGDCLSSRPTWLHSDGCSLCPESLCAVHGLHPFFPSRISVSQADRKKTGMKFSSKAKHPRDKEQRGFIITGIHITLVS